MLPEVGHQAPRVQDIEHNAVHGSDSIETAEKEIKLFFRADEIFDY